MQRAESEFHPTAFALDARVADIECGIEIVSLPSPPAQDPYAGSEHTIHLYVEPTAKQRTRVLPLATEMFRERFERTGRLTVAHARISRFEGRLVLRDPHDDWYQFLSSFDDLPRLLGMIADGFPPLSRGVLLYPESLDVHPNLRGRSLGLKLLDQAIGSLRRDEYALTILYAHPIRGVFLEPHDSSKSAPERLAAYYHRAGFEAWDSQVGAGIFLVREDGHSLSPAR